MIQVSEGTINVNNAVASFRASHVFIIVLEVEIWDSF